jgi:hypothetical protein
MTQERFSGLATITLESDILEKINYNAMIEDFILKNARPTMLFGRPLCLFYFFNAIFIILQ